MGDISDFSLRQAIQCWQCSNRKRLSKLQWNKQYGHAQCQTESVTKCLLDVHWLLPSLYPIMWAVTWAEYDNKDCPGQVTYSVGQVKISVACPTGQVAISFFVFLLTASYISIQAPDFMSLWQFLFCSSTIATSVSFHIIKLTDFSVVACDWLASAVKPIRS